jgi:hypothetical protein
MNAKWEFIFATLYKAFWFVRGGKANSKAFPTVHLLDDV